MLAIGEKVAAARAIKSRRVRSSLTQSNVQIPAEQDVPRFAVEGCDAGLGHEWIVERMAGTRLRKLTCATCTALPSNGGL